MAYDNDDWQGSIVYRSLSIAALGATEAGRFRMSGRARCLACEGGRSGQTS